MIFEFIARKFFNAKPQRTQRRMSASEYFIQGRCRNCLDGAKRNQRIAKLGMMKLEEGGS